ncbi:phosphatidylglycerophosphatase A [Wigglesworthia glossinidia endosymbiont of Glossina morsitans morsitans (Yale colony)]|uniref:Phosphatidylglycerophosphatase A n=1 Tax=Wigglesworthia glossinidia endosymbiont of Glossina morsitans morsitans (Yale colony) TaxID=1142511 RepID=H6Q5T4_WIGGL|nr:phosphatidylglycerophosphatase A [Wigglesworthia glossinidia]AFA41130.1 phosphatidylglycerophosphatase A [Wigglesworthia glossinidia endosymbiont of Glossina morsitans morsitans (Yale colony)]
MQINKKDLKFNICNPIHFLATGFGVGLISHFPGTIASVVAIFIWNYIYIFFQYHWSIVFIFFLLAVYFCDKTAQDLRCHDHPCIVLDEFIGMWIILFFYHENSYYDIITEFIVFRVFDVWKPYPIRIIHKNILNGFGIILDDIVAGIYSIIILKIFI